PGSGFSHSTPVLATVDGKPQLLVSASGAVQGLDPTDGKPIWTAANKGDVPTPVLADGRVFSIDGRGGPGIAVVPVATGDNAKAEVKWRTPAVPEGYSSAVVAGGFVYRAHHPGILKCWKLIDGELAYSERLPAGVYCAASPFATPDGRVYF